MDLSIVGFSLFSSLSFSFLSFHLSALIARENHVPRVCVCVYPFSLSVASLAVTIRRRFPFFLFFGEGAVYIFGYSNSLGIQYIHTYSERERETHTQISTRRASIREKPMAQSTRTCCPAESTAAVELDSICL